MKTHKLGSAPITDTEYAELLGNIGKLSEKDRKALRARARAYELPAALSGPRTLSGRSFAPIRPRSVARGQADRSLTSDEQIAAEQDPIARFNAQRRQRAGTSASSSSGLRITAACGSSNSALVPPKMQPAGSGVENGFLTYLPFSG